MATVKEMAKKWGCSESTVKRYCASGIVPPAEKTGVSSKWIIPDDWPKPPMGRHGLCFLLDTVCQLGCGVEYKSIRWGYKPDEVRNGYAYLVSSAFLSTIDPNNLETSLVKAQITLRGAELIDKENQEGHSKIKFRAYLALKDPLGIASLEVGGEVKNG